MDADTQASQLVADIEREIDDTDNVGFHGDGDEAIIGGYVPESEYDTVLELADEYNATESTPHTVEETGEIHISLDITA